MDRESPLENLDQNLELITRVVAASRRERARIGHIYVLWGIIVLVGTGAHAIGIHLSVPYMWVIWPVLMVGGGAYSVVEGRKLARNSVLTLGGRIEGDTWEACGLALLCVAFLGPLSGSIPGERVVPIISLLLGVAVVTVGSVYRYRFVKISGYGFIGGGAGSFFLTWPWPSVVFGVLLVLGYILPGIRMVRMVRMVREPTHD